MHTKETLISQLNALKVNPKGTLLTHLSYKSLGEVQGGPQTVLEALLAYMQEGLLVIPTHTWANVNTEQLHYSVKDTPCCIGIIPELARKRAGGFRSSHPTHSVVAFGKEAQRFIQDDHLCTTPCARNSAWGRLLDRDATILLIGVGLNRDTYIHGVEEWLDIPDRLAPLVPFMCTLSDGSTLPCPCRTHKGHPSEQFPIVEGLLKKQGVLEVGRLGDATVLKHQAKALYESLKPMLIEHPDLFSER